MKKNPKKAMGQHFLTNPELLKKIVDCISPQKKDLIIEIGAGKGSLTFLLAEKAGHVIALEKDKSLISYLEQNKPSNLKILHKDVLKTNFNHIIPSREVKLVGNLPYSISSQILFKLLKEHENIKECHFMLQKEVAERVCAPPGSKKYAPLSILLQNIFSSKIQFHLSPGSFVPPPKVKSTFISLKKRNQPLYPLLNTEQFKSFIKKAFSQRRKKLRNNLKSMGFTPEQIKKCFQESSLDSNIRPEKVSLDEFASLYQNLTSKSKM